MKEFILKNKTIIAAFLSAIVLVLQQALASGAMDLKVIGFALLLAVIGVVSKQWAGQGITILGMLSTLAGTFLDIYQGGEFTWNKFALSAVVAVLSAVTASLSPQPTPDPGARFPYNARDGLYE